MLLVDWIDKQGRVASVLVFLFFLPDCAFVHFQYPFHRVLMIRRLDNLGTQPGVDVSAPKVRSEP
jgi:hypothetical protein